MLKSALLILGLGFLVLDVSIYLASQGTRFFPEEKSRSGGTRAGTAWADSVEKGEGDVELKAGDNAPEFTLSDGQNRPVSLKDFRGKYVVLYFYPKDFTPGCTQEACDFRDHSKVFAGLNAVIVGVSKDTGDSHTKFTEKYGLPFVLLADPDAKVLKAYGVWQEKSFMGKIGLGTVRTTYLIDPQGKIAKVYDKVKVAGHVDEVLADLKQAAGAKN
jgi:peroxiredoxin Q/BCP